MEVGQLKLHEAFVTPDQTISDFLKLGLLAVPVVEGGKPVAYATLTHIIGELIPKDVFMRAGAIGKTAGSLELTHKNYFERFKDERRIGQHTIPLLATVEYNDPVIKAVSHMLEYRIPIIAVTKEGKYIGYINYESIGLYLYKFTT